MNAAIARLGRAAENGRGISRRSALALAEGDAGDLPDLLYWSNRVRERHLGRRVRFCAILSAKQGRCPEDCRFCAQSAHYATESPSYPLRSPGEIRAATCGEHVAECESFGLVTSGLGPKAGPEWERLLKSFERLAAKGRVTPCASLGVLNDETAGQLRAAGVRRYNHNLETSRRLFPSICTTHTYDDRIATIRAAAKVGMEVCCGGIFGMGETAEDRVDMAMELRELGVDSIPLNFLNPIPGTPLGDVDPLTPLECLRIIAVYRLLFPTKHIKVAGGRERNLRDLQSWMFRAGADGAILGDYLTTTGRRWQDDLRMVADLGLECEVRGHAP